MRVLFFAQLKDATGYESIEFASAVPLDVEKLWAELVRRFPKLAAHRATVWLSRNWEYADAQTQFLDTDEVALIPPVSGG